MEKIKIDINKELDLLTAYVDENRNSNNSNLNVLPGPFDGSILFHVDNQTNELVMIQIYDFSIIKRKLMKELIFLVTKHTIQRWLTTIVDSFRANRPIERYAH